MINKLTNSFLESKPQYVNVPTARARKEDLLDLINPLTSSKFAKFIYLLQRTKILTRSHRSVRLDRLMVWSLLAFSRK